MEKVAVTLTNQDAWFTDYSDEVYAKLQDYWSFYPDGYRWSPSHKLWIWKKIAADKKKKKTGIDYDINSLPGWNGKIKILKRGCLPAGLFRATCFEVEEKLGIKFDITFDRPKPRSFKVGIEKATEQYSYQDDCVDAMCKAIRRGGGIVLSATGSGKTALCGKFFSRLKYVCLFVVDQTDLLYQSQKELAKWLGEPVGLVGDSEFDIQRVTVATRQTLGLHLKDKTFVKWFSSIAIEVVDELHEQMGKTNFEILERIKPIARFGLTATLQMGKKPVRMKSWCFAGPVIFEFPLSEGVKRGVLTKGTALQVLFPEHDDIVEEYEEDWRNEELTEVVNNFDKTDALKLIARHLIRDHHVIVLADRRPHIKKIHQTLGSIPHRLAYGEVLRADRTESLEDFENDDTRLIVASKVFKKGINVKIANVIIDAAEMKSQNDTQQKYGRGIRLHETKEQLIYIDIGTQGDGRYGKRARSRARALTKLGIRVTKKKIETPKEAFLVVKRYVEKICQQNKLQKRVPA